MQKLNGNLLIMFYVLFCALKFAIQNEILKGEIYAWKRVNARDKEKEENVDISKVRFKRFDFSSHV